MLKPQWYVNCQGIAKDLIKIVKDKELKIVPEYFENDWNRWLENIQDWCISRQIWWGHQCPVYLVSQKVIFLNLLSSSLMLGPTKI